MICMCPHYPYLIPQQILLLLLQNASQIFHLFASSQPSSCPNYHLPRLQYCSFHISLSAFTLDLFIIYSHNSQSHHIYFNYIYICIYIIKSLSSQLKIFYLIPAQCTLKYNPSSFPWSVACMTYILPNYQAYLSLDPPPLPHSLFSSHTNFKIIIKLSSAFPSQSL